MIEIRNLRFQPLTFQLSGEERGIHLGSRQTKTIENEALSEEIKAAGARGFVTLTTIETPPESNPETALSVTEPGTDDSTQPLLAVDESQSADQAADAPADTETALAANQPADGAPAPGSEPAVETAADAGLSDAAQMADLSIGDDSTTTRRRR